MKTSTPQQTELATYAQKCLRRDFDEEQCALSSIDTIAMALRMGLKELSRELIEELKAKAQYSEAFIQDVIEKRLERQANEEERHRELDEDRERRDTINYELQTTDRI